MGCMGGVLSSGRCWLQRRLTLTGSVLCMGFSWEACRLPKGVVEGVTTSMWCACVQGGRGQPCAGQQAACTAAGAVGLRCQPVCQPCQGDAVRTGAALQAGATTTGVSDAICSVRLWSLRPAFLAYCQTVAAGGRFLRSHTLLAALPHMLRHLA